MRISWNWLSEMLDLGKVDGPQGLANLLTARGLEVEAIERQDQGLEKVITAKILERLPHPQADRLSICNVTTGTGDPLQIVCGAQNMRAGDTVALAQVGSLLPNGAKIEAGKIRGIVSNGMLCSEEELKLAETSEGIMILPAETPLGRPLAEILGRNDTVLVLKLTANRGDCMSHWGIARELAAALGQKPKRAALELLDFKKKGPISIHLDADEAAPQFFGCSIDHVKVGPSPEWIVKRLEALGTRSINNVVDASNLLLLELGHPTHAYDADKIEGGEIRVRTAREGETLPLLDGQTVTLSGAELVIADRERAIGLAGVMGGGNSEVQPGTSRIFLECAEFDPVRVRRAAFKHQRRTEAAQRFEKGIDPSALPHVISRLAGLIIELAGGEIRGACAAQTPSRISPKRPEIEVTPAYFEEFLGMPVSAEIAEPILIGLDCEVRKKGSQWRIIPPPYRLDLSIKEDIAEEIARSLGYDKIRERIPPLSSAPQSIHSAIQAARFAQTNRAKDSLMRAGLSETLNFAFTSKAWLAKFGMTSTAPLLNPLSEEHEVLVPSLIPGLVRNALECWRHHFGSEVVPIRLFEIRPTFFGTFEAIRALDEQNTGVEERWSLSFAVSGTRFAGGLRNEQGEVDFFDIKAILETLFESLGTKGVRFQPLSASRSKSNIQELFHPGKSVEVLAGKDVAGYFGLFHPGKARELKVPAPLWIGELNWEVLSRLSRPVYESPAFKTWSEFPPIERDFALLVGEGVTADKITQVALKAGRPLAKVAKIFDVYRGSQVVGGMTSVAVRVIFYDESRSLQESEAESASTQILEAWKKELGIQLRS
ncbi:MAG: phenylalanine--tRNA ligase subunit beta [Bdellovibrionales bacterium RIFOXYC1_FULL_54_43]|nr:MAG: phenylalanine--tRNA ligase subunit beta [Bdellovibrionales bacterium RIFOXYC1_FULL_54_43]OFZ80948.1 MAG: phenylalanine--tRNA ligase subunit beta [Bdellovibrionales bacterium RIFOXYD1_FULL_55_31]